MKQVFIEISSGGEKPRIHRLDKTVSTLGSLPESDVYIRNKEVSRKHLMIYLENEACYIVDRGSTNGTFINDVKIDPGKKVEWPNFAHLRLGTKTVISQVDEPSLNEFESHEISIPLNDDFDEKTRTISRADLQRIKTEELVKQKQSAKALPKKKKKKYKVSDLKHYLLITAAVLSFFAYDRWDSYRIKQEEARNTPVAAVREKKDIPESKKVPKSLLIEKKILNDAFDLPKCVDEAEKKLCELISPHPEAPYGVRKLSSSFIVYIDATNHFEEATTILYSGDEEDMKKLVGLLYFFRSFSSPEIEEVVGKDHFILVFYQNNELKHAMTFKSKYIKELQSKILESHFLVARKIGMSAFKYTEDYVTIY